MQSFLVLATISSYNFVKRWGFFPLVQILTKNLKITHLTMRINLFRGLLLTQVVQTTLTWSSQIFSLPSLPTDNIAVCIFDSGSACGGSWKQTEFYQWLNATYLQPPASMTTLCQVFIKGLLVLNAVTLWLRKPVKDHRNDICHGVFPLPFSLQRLGCAVTWFELSQLTPSQKWGCCVVHYFLKHPRVGQKTL